LQTLQNRVFGCFFVSKCHFLIANRLSVSRLFAVSCNPVRVCVDASSANTLRKHRPNRHQNRPNGYQYGTKIDRKRLFYVILAHFWVTPCTSRNSDLRQITENLMTSGNRMDDGFSDTFASGNKFPIISISAIAIVDSLSYTSLNHKPPHVEMTSLWMLNPLPISDQRSGISESPSASARR
jgi:hypothetical protein